ncbi:hypothetical protein [Streptomyces sp. NPDC057580]|uniref:hypothetical protein n=1 Tax=Streptomyces sp. NPDC057580 TaxID=3346173 RepID=UPI0036B50D62
MEFADAALPQLLVQQLTGADPGLGLVEEAGPGEHPDQALECVATARAALVIAQRAQQRSEDVPGARRHPRSGSRRPASRRAGC